MPGGETAAARSLLSIWEGHGGTYSPRDLLIINSDRGSYLKRLDDVGHVAKNHNVKMTSRMTADVTIRWTILDLCVTLLHKGPDELILTPHG